MALPVTITGINTTVACVGPFKVAVSLVAQNVTGGNVGIGAGATSQKIGQTFTVGASAVSVTQIKLLLYKAGSPTDNCVIDIYATDGSSLPTGSSLGTSNVIDQSTIPATPDYLTVFDFSPVVSLSPSTKYAFVISRSGAIDGSNYVLARTGGASSQYSNGEQLRLYSGVWETVNTDLTFTIFTNSDAFYFFGRNGTTATTLSAFKATAPDTSWSSIATKTGFTTAILNLAACQVGHIIHMLVQDGTASTSLATKYISFDTSDDTFLTTTETVSAAVAVTGQIAGAGAGASLVVRSDGSVVTFYNGVQTKTSGTFRARVYYRIRTALNTYGTETEVDANTAVDNNQPLAVLGASDRVHFLFFNQTNTHQRHLTSANSLGTAASTGATTAMQDVCRMIDGGTIRHVGFTAAQACRWNSADNPTVTAASITTGTPVRTVDYNLIVYALYQNSADSDLYIKSSSDNGATFGSATNVFTGTVASAAANLSKNQTAYQRGSAVVFPYVVNDNGTLKYNEYIVGAAFSPARVDLALSSTAPTASVLAGFPNISPAQANLALSPTQAAVGVVKDLNTVDLVLSTTAPTFSTLLNIPISPTRVDLALTPTVPTSILAVTRDVPRVDLALSPTVPTSILAVARDPLRVDLALTPTAPTSVRAIPVDPARVDLALSASTPTATLSVSANPARVDLALSATIPSVSVIGAGTQISPPQTNLAISGSQPAVGAVKDLNAADLIISATAPTRTVESGIFANPARVDLALTTTAPTATPASFINIPQGNLALTTAAPAVSVLSGLIISPPTVNLAITPTQPAIGAAKDLNAANLSISTTAPTVSLPAGAVSRSPPAVNLAISSLAPDAGLASDIPIAQLAISTTAPTRSVAGVGTGMSPARVDLVISRSVPTVTVSAANNTTITPDTRDLAISNTVPTVFVTVHASVAPSTRDLVLSTTVPSVELAVTSCIILPPSVNLLLSTAAASSIRTAPPRPQLVRFVRPMTHIMRRW